MSAALFEEDELLHLNLTFSMSELSENRIADASYQKAILNIGKKVKSKDLAFKIRTRGNFRLDTANCVFPPLTLKFDSLNAVGTIFEGHKKLKLVTHCSDEKYILKEYLAYKTYNLLNPNSLRVRLAKITYNDKDDIQDSFTKFAFLIEHKKSLANRISGSVIERDEFEKEALDRSQTTLLYAFQYLLGNRDWGLGLAKNIVLIRISNQSIISVPYDFDFTGWVDASYTLSKMGIDREAFEYRVKRKLCRSEEEWRACFAHFLSKEDQIKKMIKKFRWLKRKEKKILLKYVDAFYKDILDPQRVETIFIDC